jgi:tRNA dimethylallyltransferase
VSARDTDGNGSEVWLVAGPTASGKSALALRLAERLGAEVVNADSMQAYRDLRLLTARPTPEEEAQAPHRLYGHVDGAEAYSVGRWLRAVATLLAEPGPKVVVGGTGLYFRALTVGLAEMPEVPEAARLEASARLDREGEAAFRLALAEQDPEAERRIASGDRQRLVRAGAVLAATGRSLSAWRAQTRPPLDAYRAVVLDPPRPALYARCDARLRRMLAEGALEEVRALLARGLPPDLPVMKAVGLRELAACLEGALDLGEALALAQRETRRYAKRQLTWFRNQTPAWPRLDSVEPEDQWRQFLALPEPLTRFGGRETAASVQIEQ